MNEQWVNCVKSNRVQVDFRKTCVTCKCRAQHMRWKELFRGIKWSDHRILLLCICTRTHVSTRAFDTFIGANNLGATICGYPVLAKCGKSFAIYSGHSPIPFLQETLTSNLLLVSIAITCDCRCRHRVQFVLLNHRTHNSSNQFVAICTVWRFNINHSAAALSVFAQFVAGRNYRRLL